jgi:type II secretory pathway pseudopilin PulG
MRALISKRLGIDRGEAGMTIIEVVVAAVILALGALAAFGVLSAATKNNQRAKSSQVALNRAQEEIEKLRSLQSKQLAMTAAPPHEASSLSPNYRVNSANSTFALIREPPSSYEDLVVNNRPLYGPGFVSGGIVSPGPTPFTSGDVSGDIYRYVVWRDDTSCPAATCPGDQDFKQIVVAVKLDTPGNQSGERGYVEVTSDFVDPTDSALNDPIPGANGVVTAQQFYLSDTPCSPSGVTTRQEITGNHLLHNTLGTCPRGLQTGSTTAGAPDALLTGVPPDPDINDESNPPLYDYSDDVYLEPTPDTDKGVQILRDETPTCHFTPTGTTHPEAQTHRWVTDPMTSNFTMLEKVTLEFYTRTLSDESYNGQLCIFLFKRHENGSNPPTDTRLTDKSTGAESWIYNPGGTGWWRGAWEKVRREMTFNGSPYTIPKDDRLGIGLTVERANTTGTALAFMYDHPRFPTRLEVDTNTPINGG